MAQAYTSRTRTVGFLFSLILAAIFVLFGGNIVGLYNSNPEIIRIGGHIMLIVAFLQPFQSSQFIVAGGLRGAGDTRTTAMITLRHSAFGTSCICHHPDPHGPWPLRSLVRPWRLTSFSGRPWSLPDTRAENGRPYGSGTRCRPDTA